MYKPTGNGESDQVKMKNGMGPDECDELGTEDQEVAGKQNTETLVELGLCEYNNRCRNSLQ